MLEVYKFNKQRNKFTLDEKLEHSMLLEEMQVFYNATSMSERVIARLNVDYVYRGSLMKYNYNGRSISDKLQNLNTEFTTIANAILQEEFDNQQMMNKVLSVSWTKLCEANKLLAGGENPMSAKTGLVDYLNSVGVEG